MKRVFFFGNGRAEGAGLGKERLGGKGSGLAEMTALGIPVPPGFTIEAAVSAEYSRGTSLDGLKSEVSQALAKVEEAAGRRFGDPANPLLVSVRSGARSSMPGMMDTILNLGLNSSTVKGLSSAAGERFALDCRRRFLQMYGDVVLNTGKEDFEEALTQMRKQKGVSSDAELSAQDLSEIVARFEAIIRQHTGKNFPEDPQEQLWGAIGAVFRSWDNERAKTYRRLHRIPNDWGTAVNVQAMVFGNRGETSATGVAFTRDPSTGEKKFYGEFLPNAQGEDVVAGIRTPRPLNADGSGRSLEETMPQAHAELLRVRDLLEKSFHDMQDLEFTIEDGKLYVLQTRNGKRTGFAAVRIASDMVDEGLISEEEAVLRVEPEQLVQLLAPVFPLKEKKSAVDGGRLLGKGLPAGPGAACGRIALTADRAVEMAAKGDPVVLVRAETSPEDIAGMNASAGILTTRGGMTCIAGEAKVLTDRGLLSCEDAFRLFAETTPLSILSFDTKRMRPVWRRVIAAGGRVSDVISVAVSQTGRARKNTLRLTPDHKMFTIHDRELEKSRLDSVLEDSGFLTIVDRVPPAKEVEASADLAYVAGALFSDGYIRVSRTKGAVVFVQKPTPAKAEFIAAVEEKFEKATGFRFTRVRRRETVATLRGRTIRGSVEDRFCTRRQPAVRLAAIRDNLTAWVLGLDRPALLNFLAGYVDGDGTYSLTSSRVRLQIVVSQKNRKLLEGLAIACLRLGIVPQISNNRESSLLQIAEGVDDILQYAHRVRVRIPARSIASKCFAVNGLFHDIVDEVNFMGRVREGIKRNLLLGVDKLQRDVLPLCKGENRRQVRALLESPLRSYRVSRVAESERTLVYNFEVDATNELDKNFVVFTSRLTPVLVSNSHAAVVARGMGKTCVVGAGEITVDAGRGQIRAKSLEAKEGDWISIDGTTGEVLLGKLPTQPSEVLQVVIDGTLSLEKSSLARAFTRLLEWADARRRLGVRTNADTPGDARVARLFGAQGIGLCRTEHMFFEEHRILAVREMILAETAELRRAALEKILPMQREDFLGIFREMGDRPVTIRLLDPPLHEFLPNEEPALTRTAAELKVPVERVRERVAQLHEANPMLGHRGCRLGITHPEIYDTQVRAIFEAAAAAVREGLSPNPEVMIPLIGTKAELDKLRILVDEMARRVTEETGQKISYKVGTMIEIPRAALQAKEIAQNADFFSFGTNDLTQMTFGYSRDDAASFLPAYIEKGILPEDPFASLDQAGVGELVILATERGRQTNPKLKVGICGEHGGDPRSVEFFHRAGLDYVSCSPFRVPVARLAAARAALAGREGGISSTA
jgi:phosphoenolpyruvate synthase/pyruvate phosphate dikinase